MKVNHWLRNAIYAGLIFCLTPWILKRMVTTGRYRQGWRDKLFGLASLSSGTPLMTNAPLIWLHGVSVGEIQLLRPLIEELRAHRPDLRFAVSTTTETGMELARKLLQDSVLLFYFPLDFSWSVRRTLQALKPSLIVLGELELWPNLLDTAHAMQVPIAVVNGRLSERSFRGYQKFFRWTRGMFSKLNSVSAQSATYAQRFVDCGTPPDHVRVTGSLKFDNVSFDRHAPEVESLRRLVGLSDPTSSGKRVWVVGSTQTDEEKAACSCFARVREEFPDLKLIIIPRHRERFDTVADELRRIAACQSSPLHIIRRSTLAVPVDANDWDVLLVDTIGELRWWWGLAEIAVVGGSFGKRGGQNMLEPAAYGVNVGFGPNTSNFRDVVEMLLASDAAQRIASLDALDAWLLEQLRNPEAGQQRGQSAQKLVEEQQGALQRTGQALLEMLPVTSSPLRRVA